MDIDITDLNSTRHDGMKYSVWPTVGSKKYKMQLKVHFSRQISVQFRRLGLIRRMTVQGWPGHALQDNSALFFNSPVMGS